MMRYFQNIIFLSFLLTSQLIFSQKYSISGLVKDSISEETLVGANIFIKGSGIGTLSNQYGFYSINLPSGTYNISFSYLGFHSRFFSIKLSKDTILNCILSPYSEELKEVIISSSGSKLENPSVSKNDISIDQIKVLTTSLGVPDLLKSLQLMPGVQAVNEGSTNIYVRGGSFDQNLFLLDEAPVYNPSHALGFFSVFNTDALKNVSIYKGGFPAHYGGRLSSVIDITMREGNYVNTKANASVGVISSNLSFEGPIIKHKASYYISGRYSYPGLALNIINHFAPNSVSDKNKIWFYDLNAKVNFLINNNNRIYLSAYSGSDDFYCFTLNNKNQTNWGNNTSTLRWNHVFSSKLFYNLTSYYSKYNYKYDFQEDIRNYIWEAGISEIGMKNDFTYYLNHTNTLKFGLSGNYNIFHPGKMTQADSTSIIRNVSLDSRKSMVYTLYVENDQKVGKNFSFNYGIRSTLFSNYGPGTVYIYNDQMTHAVDSITYLKNELINDFFSIEPRISSCFQINRRNSIKAAYSYTTQFLHLLSNSTVGLPTDLWLPPDKYIKPQYSNQYVIGYYSSLIENILELSIEGYYKTLENIIDYRDNSELFMNKHIETQILSGHGKGYGIEILIEKKGRLSGWTGYSLAKTRYQIQGINYDNDYSPRYDIRHNFSVTGYYKLNRAWLISSTFKLASGGYITLPEQVFYIDGASFFDYSHRNNFKLPPYHRLDISAIYKNPKANNHLKGQWTFSIYNIYNHKNIYSLFVKQDHENFTFASAYKMYLYGVVPTISYSIKL